MYKLSRQSRHVKIFPSPLKESLANAKVSARQQSVYEAIEGPSIAKQSTANQCKGHNAEKYIQWLTTLSLTIQYFIRLSVVAPKSVKSREIF